MAHSKIVDYSLTYLLVAILQHGPLRYLVPHGSDATTLDCGVLAGAPLNIRAQKGIPPSTNQPIQTNSRGLMPSGNSFVLILPLRKLLPRVGLLLRLRVHLQPFKFDLRPHVREANYTREARVCVVCEF